MTNYILAIARLTSISLNIVPFFWCLVLLIFIYRLLCVAFIHKRMFYSTVFLMIIWCALLQMTFLLGILVNEVVNLIIKHTLAHPRLCGDHVFPNSSYAMPSDHSQFMAFFAVYSILFIYIR